MITARVHHLLGEVPWSGTVVEEPDEDVGENEGNVRLV